MVHDVNGLIAQLTVGCASHLLPLFHFNLGVGPTRPTGAPFAPTFQCAEWQMRSFLHWHVPLQDTFSCLLGSSGLMAHLNCQWIHPPSIEGPSWHSVSFVMVSSPCVLPICDGKEVFQSCPGIRHCFMATVQCSKCWGNFTSNPHLCSSEISSVSEFTPPFPTCQHPCHQV